ncbi:helix-turn-helix domain-containing protein [Mucilaginibacter antarcticus]|uniref:Helix-turn-helix domain-containing protein n=1 Tax=Mucilaginibacter antarcticus TaxID=1855725 RepID=A0ABW5XR36_9SPHI
MKIYIKNMVCIRCKILVKQQLKKLAIPYMAVELGEVEITGDISSEQMADFKTALQRFGLDVLDNRKSLLIDKIKKVIIELIHYEEGLVKLNFSDHLSKKLNHDYTYMANLFSEVEGINVEHYLITHKIERVKELLIYDKLSLTAISYKLQYSSVAHLCNQFKKITGLTPTHFKKFKEHVIP